MNILESIAIPLSLFQICSLIQLKLEKKTWSTTKSKFLQIYTYIVMTLSVTLLFAGMFTPSLQDGGFEDIGDTVDFIQLIGIRFAHIVTIVEALVRHNRQEKMLKKIQEIDKTFELSLNFEINNRQLRWKAMKLALVMFTLYLGSELCILTKSILEKDGSFTLRSAFYFLPLFVCGLRYYQYLLFVLVTKIRFEKLVEILGDINLFSNVKSDKVALIKKTPAVIKFSKALDHMSKPPEGECSDLTNLLVIRDLYNSLWELTILINQCFGLSILVNVGNDFFAITSNCYWIFLNITSSLSTYEDFLHIGGSAVWSIPHLFNVMALAMMCQKTVEITLQIALAVHRVQINVLNDNHNSLIEQFSLQLLHQKIQFTAFGFFTIDCTLLYTIVGATTTYLIILIQFHMSGQKDYSTRDMRPFIANTTQ